MRALAIGDIHGSHVALVASLDHVGVEPGDRVIFLGDYIDRGPASRQVIETLLQLAKRSSATFLRGNHELMMLDAREDPLKSSLWQSYGGLETLYSYGLEFQNDWVSSIPAAHWVLLEETARFVETGTHLFVHACLDPELEMTDQPDWLLFWEFFDRIGPHKSGKQIICGHTPQSEGRVKNIGFAVGIDTGPAKGGWLTCLEPSSGKYWQANESGKTRSGNL